MPHQTQTEGERDRGREEEEREDRGGSEGVREGAEILLGRGNGALPFLQKKKVAICQDGGGGGGGLYQSLGRGQYQHTNITHAFPLTSSLPCSPPLGPCFSMS